MSEVALRVPGRIEYRDLAMRVVAASCKVASRERTISEEFLHELVSAVGEAFNNVVFHAYVEGPVGSVTLRINNEPAGMEVCIEDTGASFDPDDVPPPDLEDPQEGGMGIYIMRAFVDTMTYESGSPNVLRLFKKFKPAPSG